LYRPSTTQTISRLRAGGFGDPAGAFSDVGDCAVRASGAIIVGGGVQRSAAFGASSTSFNSVTWNWTFAVRYGSNAPSEFSAWISTV